jgi:protein gp37
MRVGNTNTVRHGTDIGWTHVLGYTGESWNPTRGEIGDNVCARISPGCDFCYAAGRVKRFYGIDYATAPDLNDVPHLDERKLRKPYGFKQPSCFFLASSTDIFGEWMTDAWLDRIFDIVRDTPQHLYQVLTKRPQRLVDYLSRQSWWPLPNVWVGTSVELQRYAWRAAVLTELVAPVHFISAEPLLGLLDLQPYFQHGHGIQWVISGGESRGPADRRLVERRDGNWQLKPFAADWLRSLRDQCQHAGVAYFHKQNGGPTHAAGGCLLDGQEWKTFPNPRIQWAA